MTPIVTVGLDSTSEALSAAHWAAQEAESRHATLRVLHAWVPVPEDPARQAVEGDRNDWPQWIVDRARRVIEERYPGLSVMEDLIAEDPAHALLEAAGESELLVLGSRDMAPLASYFLGDIGLHVVARAGCPTVLVRARRDTGPVAQDGDVVVGLGLHGPYDAVFEFAFEAAARRGVALRAVHGRSLPAPAYTRDGIDPFVSGEVAKEAQRELTEALRPWRAKFPGVRTVDRVLMESPASAVVRGAAGGGLLVVGRRRNRPTWSSPVGHVLSAAVHHAPCPVAVVPHG
ncbi:universal stress protein [Streptomyces sp. NBC_01387]|uniref:universal stress protein n=1 Tax=unclassified Streptomyces TaxID=2593676 RepID=UPI002023C6B6|nr:MULTISPECIES: universal stress protein [unclassified Streptomyces]MCX4552863.1 universal stress protein [Streptomyces sp. NBC_01500]WSC24193.1 universal stress protein [Streptomyces sp. NBC_01766]WSV58079.1 universal stress protein [Streptomyces sp. NBC_01014]